MFETTELACSVGDACEAVPEEDEDVAVLPELSCEQVNNRQRGGIATMK